MNNLLAPESLTLAASIGGTDTKRFDATPSGGEPPVLRIRADELHAQCGGGPGHRRSAVDRILIADPRGVSFESRDTISMPRHRAIRTWDAPTSTTVSLG